MRTAIQLDAKAGEPYELPTFDPGRALVTDPRVLKDLLDDEDDERALRGRSRSSSTSPPA